MLAYQQSIDKAMNRNTKIYGISVCAVSGSASDLTSHAEPRDAILKAVATTRPKNNKSIAPKLFRNPAEEISL
jgi:hypothetical protein